jgi:hypothetical protein
VRAVPLVGALLTVAGLAFALHLLLRDRRAAAARV